MSFRKLGLIRGLAVNAGNVLSLRVGYLSYISLDKCFVASGLYHIFYRREDLTLCVRRLVYVFAGYRV